MEWIKLKHIFTADNHSDWMYSHGANPVFKELEDGTCRVFFTCRDKMSKSYIAYLDLDFDNNFEIINISKKPVLAPGELGLFDDSGVVMGCFQEIEGEEYLYYLGWNLKVTVPWMNTIGLAKYNKETEIFEKVRKAPIMDRSHEDPFSISYPCVLFDNGIYKMWYGSNLTWGEDQSNMNHIFKYAESKDGIQWDRTNKIVVNLQHKGEYALSKPWVIKDVDTYKMWYSYRASEKSDKYRIGYAESKDGIEWVRMDDNVGIDVSNNGWDSDMISYPCVFDYKGQRYMLYTGNDYGKAGFGIAVLKS